MSKNFEQNFSLKDWVTKRAANMPDLAVEETVLQVQNGVDIVMRAEKINSQERILEKPKMTSEPAEEKIAESEDNKNSLISPRISNGLSAPVMPASPAQQIQIVRLLRDLGDRLRQSEKEREILWRELDSCRKLLTDIEDKTSKTEKAYLSIENKLNAPPEPVIAQETDESKEFRKNISEKISALETTTGSAVLRLEDAISENGKLARRLEQVTQERVQLLNKIEEIQETLNETQDTLRAKALVLLTDHALANKTTLAQTPAWSGNDTLKMKESPVKASEDAFDLGNQPWWKTPAQSRISTSKMAFAVLIILGMAGGIALTKVDLPVSSLFKASFMPKPVKTPEVPTAIAAPVKSLPVSLPPTEQKADSNSHMNDMAQIANQIEPGNTDISSNSSAAMENLQSDTQSLAQAAEDKAKASFEAEKTAGPLSSRIKANPLLPANVKAIEAKAFAGDAEAQHDLAAVYTAGHAGVKINYTKAAEWFTEAAHNNIANAQYNLAVLYHQGLGVKQDTKHAIDLYRIAASNHHPEAEYNLGIAHIEGIGADYNPQIAAYYFQKAAQGGVIEAAYNLGLIEENGLLGEAQPDEAIFWYKLAAARGNTQAQEALTQLSKQLGMTDQQMEAAFKRVVVGKAEYVKSMSAPAVKPVTPPAAQAIQPVPSKPAKTVSTVAPASRVIANKAPVPLGVPTAYDPVIVAQIQEQLIRLGLYSGSADGAADDRTKQAVRAYQSANKLNVDGNPSEDVLVHMLASDLQSGNVPASN